MSNNSNEPDDDDDDSVEEEIEEIFNKDNEFRKINTWRFVFSFMLILCSLKHKFVLQR